MGIKLSILTCSTHNRTQNGFLERIYKQLNKQAEWKPVELLGLIDNKLMTIGEKKNRLKAMAKWEYIAYVDDDDEISEDYIDELLKAIEYGTDVICFGMLYIEDNKEWIPVKLSKDYEHTQATAEQPYFTRQPHHIMCWKKEVAMKEDFENISFFEDTKWAEVMQKHIKTEYQIDKVLYKYLFNNQTTECLH